MINPFCNIIFFLILDITTHLVVISPVQRRSTSLSTTLIHVIVTINRLGKFLEDQQSCKTLSTAKGTFKDRWINSCAVQEGPMNFEPTTTVLGKTVLIRWRATSEINGVTLGDEGGKCSRGSIYLAAVVCNASTINVETGYDLRNGIIKTQNNLNMTCGILGSDGDGILGSDGRGLVENAVLDIPLDLLDLLKGLLLIEAIEK
jgi:hypothetical protein